MQISWVGRSARLLKYFCLNQVSGMLSALFLETGKIVFFLSKILVSVLTQVGKCKSFEANIRGVASARERGKIDPPLVFQMSLSRCCKTLLILSSPTPPAETKRSELLKTFALLEAGWCCDAPRLTKASGSRLLTWIERWKELQFTKLYNPPPPTCKVLCYNLITKFQRNFPTLYANLHN